MQPEPIIVEKGRSHFDMNRWYSVALLGAIAVLAGFYFLQVYIPKQFPAVEVTEQVPSQVENAPEELTGKIYLSLAPLKTSSHFALNVYTYDTVEHEILPLLSNYNKEYLTSKISPDGSKIAVSEFQNDGEELIGGMQLLVADIEMADVTVVEPDEDLFIQSNPTWSPDGLQIAFSGKKEERALNDYSVESWGVYLFSIATGITTFVTSGTNPIFLPDGSLAVLKKDGIYRVSLPDKSETRILDIINGDAGTDMRFDVSKDGKRIVWSIPSRSIVRIIEVASWAPFTAGKTDIIETSAFWPVFSPKGEYVAMEVFDWEGEGANVIAVNQHLMIYSLRNKTWEDPFNLTPYDQNRMFITDWR